MNTVYILSGPPRVGKTTIMKNLVAATHVQLVAADAIEHGLRNVLTGEPHQLLRDITFQGTAERRISIAEGGEHKPFSNGGSEADLLIQFIEGMLDHYRRNKESVAFEGTDLLPNWAATLNIPGFTVKAAYVGCTDASHVEAVLSHARDNAHDWINDWIKAEGGDDTKIRAWVQSQAARCQQLKLDAERHGFPFFDVSKQSFESYTASVLDYFLDKTA